MQKPAAFEYAWPYGGTYPLWSDPSYWYAGAIVRFNGDQQLAAIKQSLLVFKNAVMQMNVFFGSALTLYLAIRYNKRPALKQFQRVFWQIKMGGSGMPDVRDSMGGTQVSCTFFCYFLVGTLRMFASCRQDTGQHRRHRDCSFNLCDDYSPEVFGDDR